MFIWIVPVLPKLDYVLRHYISHSWKKCILAMDVRNPCPPGKKFCKRTPERERERRKSYLGKFKKLMEFTGMEVSEADFRKWEVKDANQGDGDNVKPIQVLETEEVVVIFLETTNAPAKGEVMLQDGIQGDAGAVNPCQVLETKEPFMFRVLDGFHGANNGPLKGEPDPVLDANFIKDSIEEWPESKQTHCFFSITFQPYTDPNLRAKIKLAQKEVHEKNQIRCKLSETIKMKKIEQANVISQLNPLTEKLKQYRLVLDGKRNDSNPHKSVIGKPGCTSNVTREKGVDLYSSEEELNDLIKRLQYRIQHERNTLAEERELLREMKQLEGTRDNIIANAAMRPKIQDSFDPRKANQDQVRLIGVDLHGVRKKHHAIGTKIKHLKEELRAIEKEISFLEKDFVTLERKRSKAYDTLYQLMKEHEEQNICHHKHWSLLWNAKDLATKTDIVVLGQEFCAEAEKFMALWNSNEIFRADYERKILESLNIQQLNGDGWMKNPHEGPLVLLELPTMTEAES